MHHACLPSPASHWLLCHGRAGLGEQAASQKLPQRRTPGVLSPIGLAELLVSRGVSSLDHTHKLSFSVGCLTRGGLY